MSLYVSPTGSDGNVGSSAAPLQTIQAAPGAPITINGPETGKDRAGRYQATVYGTGRIFSINNSYYTLDGFTVDGQEALVNTPFPTNLDGIDAFKASVQPNVEDGRLTRIHRHAGVTGAS